MFILSFALAWLTATLFEYFWHRWVLHSRYRTYFSVGHREHHDENMAYPLLQEIVNLLPAVAPLGWVGFCHSVIAGIGWLSGALFYVLCAAIVHRQSHLWPSPDHAYHHKKWNWNYGIVTHLWDRVFGTYHRVDI